MSGFSASNRLTASRWYWLRPDSVCWLSQNLSVTVSARAAPAETSASPAVPTAEANFHILLLIAEAPLRAALRRHGPRRLLLVDQDHPRSQRRQLEAVRREGAAVGHDGVDVAQRANAKACLQADEAVVREHDGLARGRGGAPAGVGDLLVVARRPEAGRKPVDGEEGLVGPQTLEGGGGHGAQEQAAPHHLAAGQHHPRTTARPRVRPPPGPPPAPPRASRTSRLLVTTVSPRRPASRPATSRETGPPS